MRTGLWLFASFVATFAATSVQAQFKAEDVQAFQLKNGLKVLLWKDHSIPNANMYTFWRVGSRNESPGITGLSHFFEHMMFNGSKSYPAGSFDRVMEAAGGANNAYTDENVTVYTNWFPASALETIVDLEADRIGSLQFEDKMIESERGVVLSERSTSRENDAWELLQEGMKSTAYSAHPYMFPVIGWESDIKAWTKDDLVRYFKTYYTPANAVMVFAGDLQASELKKILADKIEPISGPTSVPPVRTVEPEQTGERRFFIQRDTATSPRLAIAYHVPESKHPDYFALDLLAGILAGGPSSRLQRSLVDQKRLATDIGAGLPLAIDPALFSIYVNGLEGKPAKTIERATLEEIERIVREGITEVELEKAKNLKIVNFYRELETINGKAESLGQAEVFFGGYARLFQMADNYKAVTRADINRVLKTYFKKSNRTVGLMDQQEPGDFGGSK